MDLEIAIRRRAMTRTFAPEPVDGAVLDGLLDLARRAPSAGNTQAVGFVVLDRVETVAAYWDITLPPGDRRRTFRWQGLLSSPVLILVTTDAERYLKRYSEPDKAKTGRGTSTERWPVPYWWVDAGAVIQNLLLLATEADLGACLFGPFDHEPALRDRFDIPATTRIVATIAVGHPVPSTAEMGRSARRPRPPLDEVIRRPEV